MAIKQISIEGNTLRIELGEVEGKILSKTAPLFNPMLTGTITLFCRLMLALGSLDRDKVVELREKLSQGEDAGKVCQEAGINVNALAQSFREDLEWPSNEKIDEMLGWLK